MCTRQLLFGAIVAGIVLLTANHCKPRELKQKNKLILSWVPFFGNPYFYFGDGTPATFKNAGCTYTDCEIVWDRHRVPLEQFDALLFHGFEDYEILFGTPNVRDRAQLYVYITLESAKRGYIPERRRNFFNMTITYRLDSDEPWPYFNIIDKVTGQDVAPAEDPKWIKQTPIENGTELHKEISDLVSRKDKMAAWFVSNCHSVSGREKFVDELQRLGIRVDIYGACGNLSCPFSMGKKCTRLVSEYYFYLAFENSLCEDYVTEKTFTGLNGGAIPIVYSGANLTRFLPENSYLDAQKLGPEKLAEEMMRLVLDPSEYASMFWWRGRYSVVKRGANDYPKDSHPFCALCASLHGKGKPYKRTIDVKDWFTLSTDGVSDACIS